MTLNAGEGDDEVVADSLQPRSPRHRTAADALSCEIRLNLALAHVTRLRSDLERMSNASRPRGWPVLPGSRQFAAFP